MGVLAVNGDELILPSGLIVRLPFTTIFQRLSRPITNVLIQSPPEKLQVHAYMQITVVVDLSGLRCFKVGYISANIVDIRSFTSNPIFKKTEISAEECHLSYNITAALSTS